MLSEGRVEAGGIAFGVVQAGTGPLALCLHGFPDSAWTWRHLLPELADAGFRAVAPFMRGYAPTEIAPDGDYGIAALARDVNALHTTLGGDEDAVLIGHDWGAEAAYAAAAIAPRNWRRLVTIGVPPLALDERLFADPAQRERFAYLFLLKTPDAQDVVAADDMAFIDGLWRDYYRADEPGLDPAGNPALVRTPPQPTLYLHGDRDGSLDVRLVRDAEDHLAPGSRMEVVEGAGHFVHLERPAAVDRRIVEWASG